MLNAQYWADKAEFKRLKLLRDAALQSGDRNTWLRLNPQIRRLVKKLRKYGRAAETGSRTPEREKATHA
jgi:hypothetical protein